MKNELETLLGALRSDDLDNIRFGIALWNELSARDQHTIILEIYHATDNYVERPETHKWVLAVDDKTLNIGAFHNDTNSLLTVKLRRAIQPRGVEYWQKTGWVYCEKNRFKEGYNSLIRDSWNPISNRLIDMQPNELK